MNSNQHRQVGTFPVWLTRFFDRLRRPTLTVTVASGLPVLLFGSLLLASETTASAQRLPQPRIFDELPPPSPSSPPPFNFPASPLPPASPNPPPAGREFNFQAPNQPIPPSRPTPASNLYRVDIFGDSPLLLSQVQQLEPEAFVRQGEGVIQAGVFADQFNAQSRVRALEAQGIRARVTIVAAGAGAESVNSGRVLSDSPQDSFASRSYFVIIPGQPRDLPEIAAEVVRQGVSRAAVSQRKAPRGPHVAVGPFDSRREADRWSSYFRSVGMDARVYFGS
jgi:hypothetical protein